MFFFFFKKYTAIGREIKADDRIEEEKDAVLFQLYRFHHTILNPKGTVPMSVNKLSNALGWSAKKTMRVCDSLLDDRLIEGLTVVGIPKAFYKITRRGIRFVEKHYHGNGDAAAPASVRSRAAPRSAHKRTA
ncbi:MAG: hypothetical protein HY894_02970 [Deltaproteobacteria bacterium]|nr:hypothetical protein [Deltaproteobacteria bacterium]